MKVYLLFETTVDPEDNPVEVLICGFTNKEALESAKELLADYQTTNPFPVANLRYPYLCNPDGTAIQDNKIKEWYDNHPIEALKTTNVPNKFTDEEFIDTLPGLPHQCIEYRLFEGVEFPVFDSLFECREYVRRNKL